jgi:ferrochelatase
MMEQPADHPTIAEPRVGVLLINLGTPDAPEAAAVRRYLAEFLSDPRVIEIPRLAWKPILHGIILRTRPKKSAEAYNQIWTNEGSPLRAIAHRQAEALRARMPGVRVHYAMR